MISKDEKIKLLTIALEKAAWFIENVNQDTEDRNEVFFECRKAWRKAFSTK